MFHLFLLSRRGCDKFCHFCVVPFTRGPEFSRPFDKIINETEQMIRNGVKEITLLGQNVNAYFYKKNSKEYESWFLKYDPYEKKKTTRKKIVKEKKNKTKKK